MSSQACLAVATALKQDSMKSKALWHLGLLLQELGDTQAAINTLDTALQRMATQHDIDFSELADCYKGDQGVLHILILTDHNLLHSINLQHVLLYYCFRHLQLQLPALLTFGSCGTSMWRCGPSRSLRDPSWTCLHIGDPPFG